ncbi:MAG: WD40/YVTN/BNR-like repeat-containing protein, partial [Candidatus Kapaibacterium sp.]
MKKRYVIFLLLSCFFLCGTNASAQWKLASGLTNSNGFYGFDGVTGFAVWGNNLLAHANCGTDASQSGATPDSLFLSTDNGQTWVGVAPNGVLPMLTVGSGANAVFYANVAPPGTNGKILSYSTDGAQTWVTDTTGLSVPGLGGGYASSIVAIGSNVFSSDGIAVYKQTAPGTTWTVDTTGLGLGSTVSFGQVGSMIASGNNLILNTGFSSLFVQASGGSWSAANSGLPSFTANGIHQWYPVDAFATSGSSVIAQVPHDSNQFGGADLYSSDFYRSTNNGGNWTKMNSAPIDYWGSTLGFTAASGSALFVVTDSGFYSSKDNGATWARQNQGLPAPGGQNFDAVMVFGGNVLIGTQYG